MARRDKADPMLVRLVLIVLLSLWGYGVAVAADPVARDGVIDLSSVDLQKSGPIRLDGEWELYWKQLLTPVDFQREPLPVPSGFLTIPGAWNSFVLKGEKLGGAGHATLRLRILAGRNPQELTLRIGKQFSAYRLWANGVLLTQNGVIGSSASEETPHSAIRQPRLQLQGQPVDLLLQISNYHFREGGIISPITLGTVEQMEPVQMRRWALALICVGSLLVMGFYHIGLYCVRRKDSAPLYFGIYALLWATCSLTSNTTDWAINLLLKEPFVLSSNLVADVTFLLSLPFGYAFLRTLYPVEFSSRLQTLAAVVVLLFSISELTGLTAEYPGVVHLLYLFVLALIAYCVVMLLRALYKGREAALLMLSGFAALGAAAINDMLFDLQIIDSIYLIHVGMFVFTLFQATALSHRFSLSFSAVERLSEELADKNRTLEDEMAERTRLEQKVVDISEDERRCISHELHDGLCQQLGAARLRFFVLRQKLRVTPDEQDELAQLSALLDESTNHAYNLSRGLWPVEPGLPGTIPSLEKMVRSLSESSGTAIEVTRKLRCKNCRNRHIVQLHRIAQEAITNAVKHANADLITVSFDCLGDSMVLSVRDNGVGKSSAPPSSGGLGTAIMHHRAKIISGSLQIIDIESGGTAVVCRVACDERGGWGNED